MACGQITSGHVIGIFDGKGGSREKEGTNHFLKGDRGVGVQEKIAVQDFVQRGHAIFLL